MISLHVTHRATSALTAFALAAMAFASNAVAGPVLSFSPVANNGTNVNTATSGQYSVEVLGTGDANLAMYGGAISSSQVLFVFKNAVGAASSITEIYFQDGTLLSIADPLRSSGFTDGPPGPGTGVKFDSGTVEPPDLPGGDTLNPKFVVHDGFVADASNPQAHFGINAADEWLGIVFNLLPGKTYDDVLAALATGANAFNPDGSTKSGVDGLRIGIHVTSFANGGSESFVSNPIPATPVPEPSTIAMAFMGLAGWLGVKGVRRYRRRSTLDLA